MMVQQITLQILLSNHKSLQTYNCRLINFSKNFGAHAAVRAGFLHSNGNYITSLPADLQISFDTSRKIITLMH
jgi:glycosyltransferase involved in cell wall biosynthesis